jgi:hypothetical protein
VLAATTEVGLELSGLWLVFFVEYAEQPLVFAINFCLAQGHISGFCLARPARPASCSTLLLVGLN